MNYSSYFVDGMTAIIILPSAIFIIVKVRNSYSQMTTLKKKDETGLNRRLITHVWWFIIRFKFYEILCIKDSIIYTNI